VGLSNPTEAVVGILALIDEVRTKMEGTRLAALPWRPTSPDAAQDLAELVHEAFMRCDDPTEVLIVVTVAAVSVASQETERLN